MKNYLTYEELTPKQQSIINSCVKIDNNFQYFFKIIENKIETTDATNTLLWSTHFRFVSVRVYDGMNLIDSFIVPFKPFYIRTDYELASLNEIITDELNFQEQEEQENELFEA